MMSDDSQVMGARTVRAGYTAATLTVYQAYPREIAEPAVRAGTFVAPFKQERMTWIKPSFLWMMYRSGWARKAGQERVLAIEVRRDGFEWALAHAALSHYDAGVHASRDSWRQQVAQSPVRIQWDPDRSPSLAPLPRRAIQVGLAGEAVRRYVGEWVVGISDITDTVHAIHHGLRAARAPTPEGIAGIAGIEDAGGTRDAAAVLPALPVERAYPLPEAVRERIGASA